MNVEAPAAFVPLVNPESRYPVIVTTSRLMTTGIDAQTCKIIALNRRIQSMSEFKQIIGRGTRINEDYDKYYFTIMDFKKATELFGDPDFDGDPVQIYEPGPDDPPVPSDPPAEGDGDADDDTIGDNEGEGDIGGGIISDPPPGSRRTKYVVGDVPVTVVAERVQYYGKDGKLITESLKDYTRKAVQAEYASLDDFLRQWTTTQQKHVVIEALEEQGVLFEPLAEKVGKDYDAFDLVCHVAFDQPPLTRRERAENVRKRNYFTKYGDKARAVLDALLDKYADQGIGSIERMEILKVQPLTDLGTPLEIIKSFGGKDEYLKAVQELETQLYTAA